MPTCDIVSCCEHHTSNSLSTQVSLSLGQCRICETSTRAQCAYSYCISCGRIFRNSVLFYNSFNF